MSTKVPTVKFSNGVDFPLLGLGTWQVSFGFFKSSSDVTFELKNIQKFFYNSKLKLSCKNHIKICRLL